MKSISKLTPLVQKNNLKQIPLVAFVLRLLNKWGWYFFIMLGFLFIFYCIRLYQVEAAREMAQEGVIGVIMDEIPEIKDRRINHYAGGLTCNYFVKLSHCIGISFESRIEEIPNINNRIQHVLENFCSIVKKRYSRQTYDVYAKPRDVYIYQISIASAYFGFYRCEEESSDPLGKVTVVSVPAAKIYNEYGKQFAILATTNRGTK